MDNVKSIFEAAATALEALVVAIVVIGAVAALAAVWQANGDDREGDK